jgi:tetratricopeptide (TPR) repeat protein
MTILDCPNDEELAALNEGQLDDDALDRLRQHLAGCSSCQLLVDATAPAPDSTDKLAQLDSGLEPGTRVGRFVVLGLVGVGGMGAVYAAYDPELARNVALKLVRSDMRDPHLEARLKREAQALAQLSHPEVIAIYEVGAFEGAVFIAMELIDGGTLRSWLKTAPRGWREIVDRFIRAGEGLAAAHAVGLVHRDFKPDNILIGTDGRQRVTDFGLVRALGEERDGDTRLPPDSPLHVTLTRPGALVGTPAFIAPEQLDGPADARSDQFSFCASLYQSLYGELPFPGERLADYVAAAKEQRLRPAARSARVPGRVRAVVVRGLKANPDERYPSMAALLTALRATRRRRLAPLLVTAALLLLAAGAVGQGWWARRRLVCSGEPHFAGIWDEARKRELHDAFVRTGAPFAEGAWAATAGTLDSFVARWLVMRGDACRATQLRHEEPERVLELRYSCLDDRRNEVHALVELLAHPNRALVARAPDASARLSSLGPCADVRALTARAPYRDEAQGRAAVALGKERVAARAQMFAGKSREAHASMVALAERARSIGYEPLLSRVEFDLAITEEMLSHFKAAERAAEAAVVAGVIGRDDEMTEWSWGLLAEIVGFDEHNGDEAEKLRRYAEAVEARRGVVPDETTANLLRHEMSVFWAVDRFDEAEEVLRRQIAIYERLPNHRREALEARGNLAVNMCQEGRLEEALPLLHRFVDETRAFVGPLHPDTLSGMDNIGMVLLLLHRPGEALPILEEALAGREKIVGEHHPNAAFVMFRVSEAQLRLGRAAEAEALAKRAMAIMLDFAPRDDPNMYSGLAQLGECELALGRRDAGLADLERAVSLAERGKVSPTESGPARFTLARALVAAGRDRPRALALARQVRDMYRAAAQRWSGYNSTSADEIDRWLAAQ